MLVALRRPAEVYEIDSRQRAPELDRYIGYLKPYATNYQELDVDKGLIEEVRNAARPLSEASRNAGPAG